ncbi:hypothetical protein D9M68_963190 [compost metagenome]
MRKEREVLEDETDAALVRRHGVDALAIKQDRAAIRMLKTGNDPQERRLAGSARPEKRNVGIAGQG